MTRRKLNNLRLIFIVLSTILLVELGGLAPNARSEKLNMAQYSPPGIAQFPWASNTSFLFRNETSYFTAFKNGTLLKEPFAVSGFGGLNGTVNLSATNPPGIKIVVDPSTIVLRAFGIVTSPPVFPISRGFYNLSIETTIPGTYIFTVTATNGTISNSLTITALVTDGPDFVLIPSYPYSSLSLGQLGSPDGYAGKQLGQAMMVWSTGFQGLVNLSTQVSPLGPSATLSLSTNVEALGDPASQTISRYVQANGKNYTTLNLNSANAVDYTVKVTGTAGGRTHSVNVFFKLRDFNLSLSTITSTVLDAGGSLLSQINVRALNGFSGLVNFTTSAPLGFSVTLSSDNVTGSGAVVMRVLNKSADPGTYNITVDAVTRGFLTHSVTLTIQVPSLLSIPAYTLPWIGAGTVVSIGAIIYLLRRRKNEQTARLES